MKKTLIIALAFFPMIAFSGCNAEKQAARQYAYINSWYNHWTNSMTVHTVREPQQNYYDLIYGLEVEVLPTQPKENITKETNIDYTCHFSGNNFFNLPIINYVHSMGFTEMSPITDYKLLITINCADANTRTGARKMEVSASLLNNNGTVIFTQKGLSSNGPSKPFSNDMFDDVLTQVLEQINWNRIASYLKTDKPAKDESNQIVKGYGDTDLEQTIIRWDIQSRPQGADLFWRVVSKTPEVKSTNNKYLMTTPYEATKAMDIKGLTYQTASNVRIILRCEKDGYLPQEKEFDVRMILDQEEISAFFKLVKEE